MTKNTNTQTTYLQNEYRHKNCLMILSLLLTFLLGVAGAMHISDLSELPVDTNNHLRNHWLLTTSGCSELLSKVSHTEHLVFRKAATMTDELATLFFDTYTPCAAVTLEKGTPQHSLAYVMPENKFSGLHDLSSWLRDRRKAEVGIMHFYENDMHIYWINLDGKRVQLATIPSGERHTFWTNSFLGHKFDCADSVTGESMGTYLVEQNSFFVLGDPGPQTRPMPDEDQRIMQTFRGEYQHSLDCKRTFTKLGFNKGRLPKDLFASIESYYYNNRDHLAIEEWHKKGGVHVNWYEVPAYMIQMPWNLKRTWQTRLKTLVEAWIGGIPLENTDIYGIRRYEDGARLISHVDRINTHAASLIINVAQIGMREPWYLEIYDHGGRLHEVEMDPGDIVYYESAKCLHARMKPLNGSHYVNIFSHYRPIGDPEWYAKENPPGTPEPLLDIVDCKLSREHCQNPNDQEPVCRSKVLCDKVNLPTLSPSLETVSSGKDLFDYWKRYSHKTPPPVATYEQTVGTTPIYDQHSEL